MSNTTFLISISTPASSIDDAIIQVAHIVDWSKQNNSRLGYLAALYRKVLIQEKKGLKTIFLITKHGWNG